MTRKMHVAAVAGSVGAVAVVTVAIEIFKTFVPVLSLGVLYVFAVLVVAFWGIAYAVPVAVASMLAFNWFFLPPLYTFTLADGSNWFALAVYLVVAVVGERARATACAGARPRPSSASARRRCSPTSRATCSAGGSCEDELESISGARPRGPRASAGRGSSSGRPRAARGRVAAPLDGRQAHGRHALPPRGRGAEPRGRGRFLPALASLLARRRRPRAARARGGRGRGAAPERHGQDRRPPGGQPRPALAAHGDPRRGGRPLAATSSRSTRSTAPSSLETIDVEARRLDRLVANLLELSRLQAGAAAPTPELWRRRARRRRRSTSSAARERVDVVARRTRCRRSRVDAAQIQRVLVNLLENALKFSPPDAPVQRARHGDAEGGDRARRRPRARDPGERARADLRAVPSQRRRRRAAAPGSGSRSRAASPRRTAAGSGPSRAPGRAPRSRSRSRSSSSRAASPRDARPRRRRRAADPARAPDEPSRRRLRGRDGGDRARRRSRSAAMRPPDAVILDLVLPDGRGTDVCRELRQWTRRADHPALGGRRGARRRSRRSTPARTTT